MIQSWDGSDLPSWFFNYWKNRFPIYEKTPSFFAECWNRELSLWGGEDRFKKHWAWFREQEITFHFFDAIKEKDKFESVFDKDKTILFWASNLWHNEYVSFQIGLAHMYDAHQLWLRSLASSTNQDIVFLQDKIFTSSGWIQPNRKNLKTLLQKIN
ncbi:hypothetical protein K2X05_00950 [bacterium]|nr:hypothetical protein [bacterium]